MIKKNQLINFTMKKNMNVKINKYDNSSSIKKP